MEGDLFRLRLIKGRVTIFEAVQFSLLLGESGMLSTSHGHLWVDQGRLVGAATDRWTGIKALERIWWRTQEGEIRFRLAHPPSREFSLGELDLLEVQARSDEFWAMMKTRGFDLTLAFCVHAEDSQEGLSPDDQRLLDLMRTPLSLMDILDADPRSDLEIVRILCKWCDQGVLRPTGNISPASGSHIRRNVVVLSQNEQNLRRFFDALGLLPYLKRRGRSVSYAYLTREHLHIGLYGLHHWKTDRIAYLRPLFERSHLVLHEEGVLLPPELQEMIRCESKPFHLDGETVYLQSPEESLEEVLIQETLNANPS